jgi:5-methylcytosine-specific restriction endonuclease McrA
MISGTAIFILFCLAIFVRNVFLTPRTEYRELPERCRVGQQTQEYRQGGRPSYSRAVPSWVKKEVWHRDGGRCAICGADQDLHFDHVIPYSKGGSSTDPRNIQLLCGGVQSEEIG